MVQRRTAIGLVLRPGTRHRTTAALTGLLLLAAGLAAPARAADDPCLDPAALDAQSGLIRQRDRIVVPAMPRLATNPLDRQIWPVITHDVVTHAQVGLYVPDPACTGVIVTVRTPTGTTHRIPLDWYLPDPSFHGHFGGLSAGIGDGGQWHFTELRRGATVLPLSPPRPFQVWLQSVVLLDHVATVPASRPVVVSGTAYDYTVDRVPVRSSGRRVTLSTSDWSGGDRRSLTTVLTNASGRFSTTVTAGTSRLILGQLAERAPHTGDADVTAWHVGGTGIQLVAALQVPAYRVPTTVAGQATPGHRTVVLERFSPDLGIQWLPVASAFAGAGGRVAITYRPAWKGPMRMRMRLSGTTVTDEFETTTVNRTSLTARTAPTTARQIRPGTKLSTYGHLRSTYDNGTGGAAPNRQVVVQAKARGVPGATFRTVATARTTSTGYYYANWTAHEDAVVRVAFLSPFPTVGWSFSPAATLEVI
jgi:hypothetical protein